MKATQANGALTSSVRLFVLIRVKLSLTMCSALKHMTSFILSDSHTQAQFLYVLDVIMNDQYSVHPLSVKRCLFLIRGCGSLSQPGTPWSFHILDYLFNCALKVRAHHILKVQVVEEIVMAPVYILHI